MSRKKEMDFEINADKTTLENISEEEMAAIQQFMEEISDELYDLGDDGEVIIDWDNQKVIAVAINGKQKEFDFSRIITALRGNLH